MFDITMKSGEYHICSIIMANEWISRLLHLIGRPKWSDITDFFNKFYMKKYFASVITFWLIIWVSLIPFYLSSSIFSYYIPIPSVLAIGVLSIIMGFIGYRYISEVFPYVALCIGWLSMGLYFLIPYVSWVFPILRDGLVFSEDAVCNAHFCYPVHQKMQAECYELLEKTLRDAHKSWADIWSAREKFESQLCNPIPEDERTIWLKSYKKWDSLTVLHAKRMQWSWYYELENGMNIDINTEYYPLIPKSAWTSDVLPLSWWISRNF